MTHHEMSDYEHRNSPYLFNASLRNLFIEFLRAISATDLSGRKASIETEFYNAVKYLGNIDPQERNAAFDEAIGHILELAKETTDTEFPRLESIAQKGCKVIAEKISKVRVQQARAETNLSDEIREREIGRQEYIKKHRGY